ILIHEVRLPLFYSGYLLLSLKKPFLEYYFGYQAAAVGQGRFRSLIPSYLRDSAEAVIVFDLTS
ncbi:hypothetical protein E2320_012932, partial [Naja naja]